MEAMLLCHGTVLRGFSFRLAGSDAHLGLSCFGAGTQVRPQAQNLRGGFALLASWVALRSASALFCSLITLGRGVQAGCC